MDGKLRLMRAVVDIGSNSTKFLIAASQRGAEGDFETGARVTRLGKGVHTRHRFDDESFRDTVAALESFAQQIHAKGCQNVTVVGTSAVRDAQDRDRLGLEVRRLFGVELRVLSGLEEAEYSMRGAGLAANAVYAGEPLVFCEVGGASSQVGMVDPAFEAHSFQAGAVRCHEGLGLVNMPVPDATWAAARARVGEYYPETEWRRLEAGWPKLGAARAVVIGGSLVLAARLIGAKPVGTRGHLCTRGELDAFTERLRRLSLADRRAIPGMDADRADVLPAGLLCVSHMLERIGKEEFFVTGWGLRYGLIA